VRTRHREQLPDLVDIVSSLPLRHGAGDDVARRRHRVHRAHRHTALVALLAHDAEVAELEALPLAHEDVHRREVAVEQVTAVELAENLQDARNLAAHPRLAPTERPARQESRQVAVARVLEREVVQDPAVRAHQREHVVHRDRARVAVEQIAEVRLADPAVDAVADLDAHRRGHRCRSLQPARQVDLAKAAFPEQTFDPVLQTRFRAGDHLRRHEQFRPAGHGNVNGAGAARCRVGSARPGPGSIRHG
jgi:hypothetical protein